MPGRLHTLQRIIDSGLIAVIRVDASTGGVQALVDTCKALRDGGVLASEITMTSPNALDAIHHASEQVGNTALVGVGSVLDPQTARAAILAGASFVFGPTLNLDVITTAHRYDKPVVPGALTPTEILTAFEHGADMVKVFPANHFGPTYFKDILAPMPHLRLTPTGGVTLDTAADWIKAGAVALGVGSALVKKDLIKNKDFAGLTKLARQFKQIVDDARAS
ncbi:MAG: bifunctional 4-hydroxy-2-oxoglutarate aldolase/2-dehydro-3-deoxy-phosphogluconate aldolase [Phycisphaera sp.]|nr:bifunctional 4-hydroxy-2-oxoglutarate aldolase/2-dehydro-3-deoxy-phosphogluconate aldolase [Phycisphaera sp.]